MKTSDNLQPQLTTGDFIGLGTLLAYCHHGTCAVAVADVAVYYAACQLISIENFFGIYGHQYAFPFVSKIDKLVGVGERIHHHPAQIHLAGLFVLNTHRLKIPQKSSIIFRSSHSRLLKGVWAVRNTAISAWA